MSINWWYFDYVIIDQRDEGVRQIPVAAPEPAPAKFVRTHAGISKREVRWVAAARGEFPEVPAANSFTKNYVLLISEFHIQSPKPLQKGVYLYVVMGRYEYGLSSAQGVDMDIPVGGLPPTLDTVGPREKAFPRYKFKRFLNTGKAV